MASLFKFSDEHRKAVEELLALNTNEIENKHVNKLVNILEQSGLQNKLASKKYTNKQGFTQSDVYQHFLIKLSDLYKRGIIKTPNHLIGVAFQTVHWRFLDVNKNHTREQKFLLPNSNLLKPDPRLAPTKEAGAVTKLENEQIDVLIKQCEQKVLTEEEWSWYYPIKYEGKKQKEVFENLGIDPKAGNNMLSRALGEIEKMTIEKVGYRADDF